MPAHTDGTDSDAEKNYLDLADHIDEGSICPKTPINGLMDREIYQCGVCVIFCGSRTDLNLKMDLVS